MNREAPDFIIKSYPDPNDLIVFWDHIAQRMARTNPAAYIQWLKDSLGIIEQQYFFGPYPDLDGAKAAVPVSIRHGLTVGVLDGGSVAEYWWKDGTADNQLVVKETGGTGGVTTKELESSATWLEQVVEGPYAGVLSDGPVPGVHTSVSVIVVHRGGNHVVTMLAFPHTGNNAFIRTIKRDPISMHLLSDGDSGWSPLGGSGVSGGYVPMQFDLSEIETTSRLAQVYEGKISNITAIARDNITGASLAVGTYFTFTYRKASAGGAAGSEMTVTTLASLVSALSTSTDSAQVAMIKVNTSYITNPCSLLLKITP